MKPAPKVVSKVVNPKEACLEKLRSILMEYELESDIPLSHEYWAILNRYRSLLSS
jgi:hypothetical protein